MLFLKVARPGEQDLIPVLDVEDGGIRGVWRGKQLCDSVRVFVELVKRYYGKYPVIYSNENFYNNELANSFGNCILFISNYNRQPKVINDRHYIWQYSERGHLKGIGEYVDLNRFFQGGCRKYYAAIIISPKCFD